MKPRCRHCRLDFFDFLEYPPTCHIPLLNTIFHVVAVHSPVLIF